MARATWDGDGRGPGARLRWQNRNEVATATVEIGNGKPFLLIEEVHRLHFPKSVDQLPAGLVMGQVDDADVHARAASEVEQTEDEHDEKWEDDAEEDRLAVAVVRLERHHQDRGEGG
jgi:hypothetical protein